MIIFNNVTHNYNKLEAPAVKGVSFELEEGSFHFLTGPSGAGKTTIFRMLYMDIIPSSGAVNLFGKNVCKLSREEIALTRRHMGVVFQDANLLNHLNVRENVSLPLSLHGKLTKAQEKCIDEILDWVGLGSKLNSYPQSLSGGEKQRVGIARAVVNRPKLLIADEPTGNVDEAMSKRIMHLFKELNRHGTTILIASHDRSLLDQFPYPRINIKGGKLTGIEVPEKNNAT